MFLNFIDLKHLVRSQLELGLFFVACDDVINQKSFFLHLSNDMIFDAGKFFSSSIIIYEFQDCFHHRR